uniref:Interleukin-1 n=1 Tax=Equus caballus TaxID=9796 RepID=A0A9R8QHX6_HORSE
MELSFPVHVLGVLEYHTSGRKLDEDLPNSRGHRKGLSTGPGTQRLFITAGSFLLFRIWDVNQKTFYMRNNQLVAGYLQESNTKLQEKIDVVPIEPDALFLGLHGRKLCLACVKSGDEIRFQLEAVNITDLSKNKEENKRFTFIRSNSGPTTSFESAACPGWFLCTAQEADRPVSLTNKPKESFMVTKFYLQEDQ